MKRVLSISIISAILLISLTGCHWLQSEETTDSVETQPVAKTIEEFAFNVLLTLEFEDIDALAKMVHPGKGVRFSPYGYVNVDTDLVFIPEDLITSFRDNEILEWGAFDGTGFPINFTFADYFDEFIYDTNFNGLGKVGINEILGTGNSLINIEEVYPEAEFVEYYVKGAEESYGMDWKSLRIVLENYEEEWKIVGIIHDEWTI